MKRRYNLSIIMWDAWRTFKRGDAATFSEALKDAWRLAKIQANMDVVVTRKPQPKPAAPGVKAERYRYAEGITSADIYGTGSRGYMGSSWCGD